MHQAPAVFSLLLLAQKWPEVFPRGVVTPPQLEEYLGGRITPGTGRPKGDRRRYANVHEAISRARKWLPEAFGVTISSVTRGDPRGYTLSPRPDALCYRWLSEEGWRSLPTKTWQRFQTEQLQNRVAAMDLFWITRRALAARSLARHEHDHALNDLAKLLTWFDEIDSGEGWLDLEPTGFFRLIATDPSLDDASHLLYLPQSLRPHVYLERARILIDCHTPASILAAQSELEHAQLFPSQMLTLEGDLLQLRIRLAGIMCALRLNTLEGGTYLLPDAMREQLTNSLEMAKTSVAAAGPAEHAAILHSRSLLAFGDGSARDDVQVLQQIQEDLRRAAQAYGLGGDFREASVALFDWISVLVQLHLRVLTPIGNDAPGVWDAIDAFTQHCEYTDDDRFSRILCAYRELAYAHGRASLSERAEGILGRRVLSEAFIKAKELARPWEVATIGRLESEIRERDRRPLRRSRPRGE